MRKYRKKYSDLSRRQQQRRLRQQRTTDHQSLASKSMGHTQLIANIKTKITNINELNDITLHNVEDEDEQITVLPLTLWEKVAMWALGNYKNRKSINEILAIFREEGHDLPKDSRTLLGTPRNSSNITVCGSGSYLHYGLERALHDLLEKMPSEDIPSHIIIHINIDGLPLCKSSKSQLWPILGKIAGITFPQVFLIGAYHGYSKPDSIDEFLEPLITEYENLKENGFLYNGNTYTVEISLVICDSPARSMVTCTKSHNGYFGCPRCIDEGDYLDHRMCFLSTSSELRIDESFSMRKNKEHHTGVSPFEKIFNMVTQFPLDPMHLRDLGIGKKILKLLLNGEKKAGKLSAKEIRHVSELLLSLKPWIPCDFVRKPRCLDELDRWKAVEFRLFLHYLGPLIFAEVLPEAYALHFNALHAALTILGDSRQYKENNQCAHDLLKCYVETFKTLYGEKNVVFTVHCLQHLSEEALRHGSLDYNTAYPFGNFMQILKKLIRRPTNPLPQLFRQLVHASQYPVNEKSEGKRQKYPKFLKSYKTQLPFGYSSAYEEMHCSDFKISNKQPDNCCYLKDGSVIFIEHIAHKNGNYVLIGKQFTGLSGFPHYPGDSQKLQFHTAKGFSETDVYSVYKIDKKAVVLPLRDEYYILPLRHSSYFHETTLNALN